MYAINIGGVATNDPNTLLGTGTARITNDKTSPSISNVKIDRDASGYTITCNVSDASGIDHVQFPSWTGYIENSFKYMFL